MTSGSANCCPSSLLASCILAGVSAAVPAASVTPQASQPPPPSARVGFFDQLAALTTGPDAGFAELTARYRADPRLTVPVTVFNGVLKRVDEV